MTTIVGGANGGTNIFSADELLALASSALGTHSTTQFTLSNSDFSLTGTGSGFSYSNGHPSGGTLTGLTLSLSGFSPSAWSNFSISVATLWQAISSGDTASFNNLFFAGNDIFTSGVTGGFHSDDFSGYGGDDVFNMGSAFSSSDAIDGGTGNDTVNINGDYTSVLRIGSPMMTNVENLVLGTGHSYTILLTDDGVVAAGAVLTIDGSALGAADKLHFDGSSESDGTFVIKGGAGDDILRGGHGNDTFIGGGGSDTVDYSSGDGGGVHIDLRLATPQTVPFFGSDTLVGIENIIGSNGSDVLTGNDGDNTFTVGPGNDTVDGGAGSDTISFVDNNQVVIDLGLSGPQSIGTSGNIDTLTSIENVIGSPGNDRITGSAADNVIDGGGGQDTVVLGNDTSAVTVDLSGANPVVTGGGMGNDTYIAIVSFVGTAFGDTFIGGNNKFSILNGGGGNDTLNLSHWSSAAFGSLNGSINGPDNTVVQATGMTNFVGTAFNDRITGIVGTADGGDGNDSLEGNVGSHLSGGAGNDALTINYAMGHPGGVDGGSGTNALYFFDDSDFRQTVVFTPETMTNIQTMYFDRADDPDIKFDDANVAAGATLTVEYSDFNPNSGTQYAHLDGSAETNGRFVFITREGADVLTGGAGNDVFTAGGNNDTIDGGGGGDTAIYSGAHTDYTITLDGATNILTVADNRSGHPDGTDQLKNVEFLQFSDGTISANIPANSAPTLSGAGSGVSYTEQAAGVTIAGALAVSDDSALLQGATVTISGGALPDDRLNFVTQNGISAGGSFGSTLVLTGAASVANYQAALRSITFSSASDNPDSYDTDTSRTVSFTVTDGSLTSAAANATVHVVAVNDAPVLTSTGGSQTYTEQGQASYTNTYVQLNDPDSAMMQRATVTITGGAVAGDVLGVGTSTGGIVMTYEPDAHILSLLGPGSVATYNTLLSFVTFYSTSDDPTAGGASTSRTLSFTVNDGHVTSAPQIVSFNVIGVNDAPVLAGAGNAVSYLAHAPGVVLDGALTLADPDNAQLAGATATIAAGFVAGDSLNFTSQNGISGSYNAATHVLTLSGASSVANYQAALDSVTFSSSLDDPTAGGTALSRTINWQVDDGQSANHASNVGATTINLTQPNLAPAIGGAGNATGYTEQAAAVTLDNALTVSDADSANLAGAAVKISAGFVAGDTLNFTSQNGISGAYNAATHILTLSGAASAANYQAALRAVTFSSASDNPDNYGASPARTITWSVDDGQSTNHASNTPVTTLNITAVDDPALVHNDAFAAGEQIAIGPLLNVFANNGLGADGDPDNLSLVVTAVNGVAASVGQQLTLASGALLTLNANGSFTYDPNHVFDALAAPGSGSTDTSATDTFSYTVNGAAETATVTIAGVDSNDTLHGTAGNDTFDGGVGNDTLVFTGNQADYAITFDTNTMAYTVHDIRAGSPDGTDTVRGVENFRFADGTVSYATYTATIAQGEFGGNTFVTADAANDHPWAGILIDTDANGYVIAQSVITDAGTRWTNIFDPAGTSPWQWKTVETPSAGSAATILEYGTNDDGTHFLTLHDVANQYAWSQATVNFDAAWNVTTVGGTYDGGASGVTMNDIRAAYDTAAWFTAPYDADLGAAPENLTLTGTAGVDVQYGHAGNDTLNGAGGNDVLSGGTGNDLLTGGTGDDHFVFHNGDGLDVITDFTAGDTSGDVVELHAYGIANFAALQPFMSQSGSDVVIAFDPDNTITLQHVTLATLNAGDFAFG